MNEMSLYGSQNKAWLFCLWLLCLTWGSQASAKLISIGVLNTQNSAEAQAFWQKSLQRLSSQIPEYQFVMKPLGLECLTYAIEKHQLDYIVTTPGQIVVLQEIEDVYPIATVQNNFKNQTFSHFGAVAFTRNDRVDLRNLSDLKGQSIMATSPYEYGGYQMMMRKLLQAGIHPKKDFFNIEFNGTSQTQVVESVLNEEADVGIVRTGMLESYIENNPSALQQIKVIGSEKIANYPLMHSTILYPEWSLARLEGSDIALSLKMMKALVSMPKQGGGAVYTRYYGWTTAADLTTVHGLLKALQVAPYQPFQEITLKQIVKEYGLSLALLGMLLLVLILVTITVSRINRKLANSQSELARHRDNLEKEVSVRTRELVTLNQLLEKDIVAREQAEGILLRSRNTLQGFYELSANTQASYSESLKSLIQLVQSHFKVKATFLFRILDGEPFFEICCFEGEESLQNKVLSYLIAEHENLKQGRFSELAELSKETFLFQQIWVDSNPHCFLCLVGEDLAELPEVDQELLRLMAQWVGASIERQILDDDRIKYRAQLGKVTRLFTVGELASGLAHEINQPLTAATNYISGSLRRLSGKENTSVRVGLNRSLDSLTRATDIIRRLREFVQTGQLSQTSFNLVASVERVLDLLRSEAQQKDIQLILKSSASNIQVMADTVQIEQVMLNLVRNGIESIEKQGVVDITLMERAGDVYIQVEDTGGGIADNEIAFVFDAFHSTKSDGMGLGLAICRSLIESHNRHLTVQNTQTGAQFTFTLPVSTKGIE